MPDDDALRLPSPCVVVLVGPSGSGKSTWAATQFPADQIVSSDRLRAMVGEGEHDVAASTDAFAVLDLVVGRRLARRLTTVIDTLGLDADRRRGLARPRPPPRPAVRGDRVRHAGRRVPSPQSVAPAARARRRADGAAPGLGGREGGAAPTRGSTPCCCPPPCGSCRRCSPPPTRRAADAPRERPVGLRFGLQIPSFTWPGGPGRARYRGCERSRLRRRKPGSTRSGSWTTSARSRCSARRGTTCSRARRPSAHLAAVTERVRLGAMVAGITYRNVALLGKVVATLDVLSGGRAWCGLGLGWYEQEHRAYGWALPEPVRAVRPPRGRPPAAPAPLGAGHARLRGPGPPGAGGDVLPAATPGARARSSSAVAASAGRCASSPDTPTPATSSVTPPWCAGRSTSLRQHCADVGPRSRRGGGDAAVDDARRPLAGRGRRAGRAMAPEAGRGRALRGERERRHRPGPGRTLPRAGRRRRPARRREPPRPRRRGSPSSASPG